MFLHRESKKLDPISFEHNFHNYWACVQGGHFEYSLRADNVDVVHICYVQCDLLDCCIFSYEIMPATLANTLLFILQGNNSALANLSYGGRF